MDYLQGIAASLSASLIYLHYKDNGIDLFQAGVLNKILSPAIGLRLLLLAIVMFFVFLFCKSSLKILLIGILPYAANQRYYVTPSKRNSKRLADSFRNYIQLSDYIDIIMISGESFYDKPSKANKSIKEALLEKVASNKPIDLKLYLLDPESLFLEERAQERWGNKKKKIKEYINNHKKYVDMLMHEFGKHRVFFYDCMPVFQIMRFCHYIFVANYVPFSAGRDTTLKGYLKRGQEKGLFAKLWPILSRQVIDTYRNDYDVYIKYIKCMHDQSCCATEKY